MTVLAVARRPARKPPRHARRRFEKVRDILRIPKPVNVAWDWAEKNRLTAFCLVVTVATIVVAIAMSAYWLPAVTGLGGITIGAVLTRIADNALIEENRRLEAENAGLRVKAVPPVDTSATTETTVLPRIRGER